MTNPSKKKEAKKKQLIKWGGRGDSENCGFDTKSTITIINQHIS